MLHSKFNYTTTPLDVFLGFCKLLQTAVSKLVRHNTHTLRTTNAKSTHRNNTDVFCL